jgi:hypothetical protein
MIEREDALDRGLDIAVFKAVHSDPLGPMTALMPALVPAIHALLSAGKDVDARDKRGHDDVRGEPARDGGSLAGIHVPS